MRKTIAKAVTWRLIGTAEIFAISFWTTGHIATAGQMAGITAITSVIMYVAHELAWKANTGNPAGSIRTGDASMTRGMDHGGRNIDRRQNRRLGGERLGVSQRRSPPYLPGATQLAETCNRGTALGALAAGVNFRRARPRATRQMGLDVCSHGVGAEGPPGGMVDLRGLGDHHRRRDFGIDVD